MKRVTLAMLMASIFVGVSALSGSAGASLGPVPDFPIPGTTDFYLKECSKLPEARKADLLHPEASRRGRKDQRPGAHAPAYR